MSTPSTRRRFLKGTATAVAAAGLPEWFLRREALAADDAKAAAASVPPTTQPRLPVALIGCGGRGQYVCEKDGAKHLQVVAVCDVDKKHAATAAAKFKGAEVYDDFRKVLGA